jgi:hypothetical protein
MADRCILATFWWERARSGISQYRSYLHLPSADENDVRAGRVSLYSVKVKVKVKVSPCLTN